MTTAGIGMTTAMRTQRTTLEASTSHTLPLDTSDKQTHDDTSTNPNHYLAREQHTQHHGTTAARAFNNSYKKTPHSYTFDIAAARQQQRNKKIEDTITHYIMYSNFKCYHHLLIDSGASTHQTYRYDLVENQFHNSTRLQTRRFLATASSTFPTSRTTSGS